MRQALRIRVLAVAAVVSTLVFSGCSKQVPPSTSTPSALTTTAAPKAAAPTGSYGDLNIALGTFGSEKFYPPRTEQGVLVTNLAPMFDFMVNIDASGAGLAPGVLDKWEMAPDAMSWTFYIHPGIKFHNGADLTADDVKFTMEQNTGTGSIATEVSQSVTGADVVDKGTVRVKTKGATLDLPAYLTVIAPSRGQVVPKAYVEKNGVDYFQANPIGSGPWKFVRRVGGDSIRYEANLDHWKQVPAFKNLNLLLVPEEGTRVAMLKTGMIDVSEASTEAARGLTAAGFRPFTLDYQSSMVALYGAYLPEAAGMPIADIRVRQALSMAINRDEIIKTFFYGNAIPAMVNNTSQVSRDIDTAYWVEQAARINRYDADGAKKLLADAGHARGFDISFFTFTQQGAPYLPDLAAIVQGYWAKVGVRAQLVPTDWGAFQPLTRNRPMSRNVLGQASTRRSDAGPFTLKNMDNYFTSTGYEAMFGATKPEFDKLVNTARVEADPAKKKQQITQAMSMIADKYVMLMLVRAPSLGVIGANVAASYPTPSAYSMTLHANTIKHK